MARPPRGRFRLEAERWFADAHSGPFRRRLAEFERGLSEQHGMEPAEAHEFVKQMVLAAVDDFDAHYDGKLMGHVEAIARLREEIHGGYEHVFELPPDTKELPPEIPKKLDEQYRELDRHVDAVADRTAARELADKPAVATESVDGVLKDQAGAGAPAKPPAELVDPAVAGKTAAQQRQYAAVRKLAAGNPEAEAAAARLARRGHDNLIESLVEEYDGHPAYAQKDLRRLNELSDHQLDALSAIQRADEATGGLGRRNWFDVLNFGNDAFRNELLNVVGDVLPHVDGGLAEAVGRGITPGEFQPQGVLGHFYAAKTLAADFPGARMRFEVDAPRREIDIQLTHNGRTIDVEVKTNVTGAARVPENQVAKDLVRHAGNGWQDLLYRFEPAQAGNLPSVEAAILRGLDHPDVRAALAARGMTRAAADTALRARFQAGMVGTFRY